LRTAGAARQARKANPDHPNRSIVCNLRLIHTLSGIVSKVHENQANETSNQVAGTVKVTLQIQHASLEQTALKNSQGRKSRVAAGHRSNIWNGHT
jgi:protein subunit release factor A